MTINILLKTEEEASALKEFEAEHNKDETLDLEDTDSSTTNTYASQNNIRELRKIERQIEQCEEQIEKYEEQITQIDQQLTQPDILMILLRQMNLLSRN